jgi:TonB family protein
MFMRPTYLTLVLITMALPVAFLSGQPLLQPVPATENDDLRAPSLLNPEIITFPAYLSHLHGIIEGHALVRLEVDAQGRPLDIMCLEASHEAFALAALNALPGARFQPGEINGEPTPMAPILDIRFRSRGAVVSRTTAENIADLIGGNLPHPTAFSLVPAGQLDNPLKVRFQPRPIVAEDDEGERILGEATVSYYVDRDGRVRLPMVRESSHDLVGLAAVETIRGMIFEPPTYKGKPVPVRVVQPYRVR